jgi:hypothetical protein
MHVFSLLIEDKLVGESTILDGWISLKLFVAFRVIFLYHLTVFVPNKVYVLGINQGSAALK